MSELTDKRVIQWFPGHMAKTLRQMEADIGSMDAVLFLLDARIPRASRNPELLHRVGKKPVLYLLNKADLADPAVTADWLRALRGKGSLAIAIDSRKKNSVAAVRRQIGEALDELLEKRAQKGMAGAKVRAMVCGIPNVGKSTFINTFAGTSAARTADKPGVTRGKQWISAGRYELLDMPGVLWKKFPDRAVAINIAFIGSVKDDLLDMEEVAATLLDEVKERYAPALTVRYKLTEEDMSLDGYALLKKIARNRGMLLSGAEADTERAATRVVDEFRASKLGRISLERPGE